MYQDDDGYTAMHRAAYSSQLAVVDYLLTLEEAQASGDDGDMPALSQLEARTQMGWTPLHSAAYWNCHRVLERMLVHPTADVNARSSGGQTPLHLAAQQSTGRETLLLLLTNPSTHFDVRNEQGETASDIAARSCKYHALFEIADANLNHL